MISNQLIHDFRQIVGNAQVSVSRVETELYSYDGSLAKGQPGVAVFPGDTNEAAQVVKGCDLLLERGIQLVLGK